MNDVRPSAQQSVRPLAGMVVLVTGASSGIGAHFAQALDRAGAKVVLAARRVERLQELADELGEPTIVACDVSDADDRDRLFSVVAERHGRIDGLVNNAGIAIQAPALRESVEDFRRTLEINLVAPFAIAQAAAGMMREAGRGTIVNVASVAGLQSTSAVPEAGYVASKSGLVGLTRELATQWARYGIRVNALAPGAFSTEMTGDFWDQGRGAVFLESEVPLQRAGRLEELDGVLLTLLDPRSSYLTGQTIAVDGGLTAC
jgi:NAD(P)-dependent dehydrogenase (short-subunit alcohol dehydrogenase family)